MKRSFLPPFLLAALLTSALAHGRHEISEHYETSSAAENASPGRSRPSMFLAWLVAAMQSGEPGETGNRALSPAQSIVPYGTLDIDLHCVSLTWSDPVMPNTGEMVYSKTLVAHEGRGLPFSFELSYRSAWAYHGPLGNNWEHNWGRRIEELPNGSLRLVSGNRATVFAAGSAGTYVQPTGSFDASLRKVAPSGASPRIERRVRGGSREIYTQLDPGQPQWYQLTSVEDRGGLNRITLTYDPAAGHRLQRIVDSLSQTYDFGYDATGYLQSLVMSSANGNSTRRWRFATRDLGGNLVALTEVSTPPHHAVAPTTRFRYERASGGTTLLMVGVQNPRERASGGPEVLGMKYDAQGRVVRQQFGDSTQLISMTYDDVAGTFTEVDRSQITRTLWIDQTTKAVVRREVSGGGLSASTRYEWNSDGLLQRKVYPEGNGILYFYQHGLLSAVARTTAAGLGATSIPAMRAGEEHLVTEYLYDDAGRGLELVAMIDPRGSTTRYQRDAFGSIAAMIPPAGSASTKTLQHDPFGRVVLETDAEGYQVRYGMGNGSGPQGMLRSVTRDPGGLNLTTSYDRNDFGEITRITNPAGHSWSYERAPSGAVVQVTTPEGYVTDFTYDPNGQVLRTEADHGNPTMPNARSVKETVYSTTSQVLADREYYGPGLAEFRQSTYAYDAGDRLVRSTSPGGTGNARYEFDGLGRIVEETIAPDTPDAMSTSFAYDRNDRMRAVTDPGGNVSTFDYDGFGRRTRTSDPLGHYKLVGYDKSNNVVSLSDYTSPTGGIVYPLGAFPFQRDADRLIKHKRWTYDLSNREISNRTLAMAADAVSALNGGDGWLHSTTQRDRSGRITAQRSVCGCAPDESSRYTHDSAGRIVEREDPNGNRFRYGYDRAGRIVREHRDEWDGTAYASLITERSYDRDGNLTELREIGDGTAPPLVTSMVVDAMGRVLLRTNPNGDTKRFLYDDFGRVVAELTQVGPQHEIEQRISYDLDDNTLTVAVLDGNHDGVTTYAYNSAGMLVSETNPAGEPESYTYEARGLLAQTTKRDGSKIDFTYDARGLMTKREHALVAGLAGPAQELFEYDALGRMYFAYNDNALVLREWNTLSMLETEAVAVDLFQTTGAALTPRITRYTHDGFGRVSGVQYPDGSTQVRYGYNRVGRVESIDLATADHGFQRVAEFGWRGASRAATATLGNGTTDTRGYDAYGRRAELRWERPVGSGRATLAAFTRGHDAGSRVVFETREFWTGGDSPVPLTGPADFGSRYEYDGANRLTRSLNGVGFHSGDHGLAASPGTTWDFDTSVSYEIDDRGNRTLLERHTSDNSGTTSLVLREESSFDHSNQTVQTMSTDFTTATPTVTVDAPVWDAAGNLARSSSNGQRTYDIRGRIVHEGGWTYRYGPLGRLVEKRQVATPNGERRRYYYDLERCIVEFDLHDNGDGLAVPFDDPTWTRIFGPWALDHIVLGEHRQMEWDAASATASTLSMDELFFHADFLGSIVALSSSAGDIVEQVRYDDFGTPTFLNGQGAMMNESAYGQHHLYTGGRYLPELGIYQLRHRGYEPGRGRFVSRDPAGMDELLNLYTYVGNAPIDLIDPMGLSATPSSGGGGGSGTGDPFEGVCEAIGKYWRRSRYCPLSKFKKEYDELMDDLEDSTSDQCAWQSTFVLIQALHEDLASEAFGDLREATAAVGAASINAVAAVGSAFLNPLGAIGGIAGAAADVAAASVALDVSQEGVQDAINRNALMRAHLPNLLGRVKYLAGKTVRTLGEVNDLMERYRKECCEFVPPKVKPPKPGWTPVPGSGGVEGGQYGSERIYEKDYAFPDPTSPLGWRRVRIRLY